jgi:hypothetical protein
MADLERSTSAREFKDRSGLLVLFGVLEILAGSVTALFGALAVLGLMMMSRLPQGRVPAVKPTVMFEGMLFMVLVAAFFIVMGVATVKGRRWARSLMLVTSWVWLLSGFFMLFVLIKTQGQAGRSDRQDYGQYQPDAC